MPRSISRLLPVLLAVVVAGCGSNDVRDGPPRSGSTRIPDLPDDAVPRPEAKSRYGNGPRYEVLGKHYTVMPSSNGYMERGVASWYGKKFHGRRTASGQRYDMHELTAAHPSLPFGAMIRVVNLDNGRSVVVRINDRGPFVNGRVIDLSYAAAKRLDMIRAGLARVELYLLE